MNMKEMENNMLEDTALEGVVGGVSFIGKPQFSGVVSPEASVVGQSYYVVCENVWYYGKLMEISSRGADRMYKIHSSLQNGREMAMTLTLNAARVTLYTTMSAAC